MASLFFIVLLALFSPLTAFLSTSFLKLETQPRIASSSSQQFERRCDDRQPLCSSLQTRRRVPTLTKLHSSSRINSKEKDDDSDEAKEPRERLIAQLKGTCVFLVGMMGSGKTSVGNEVARQLGYRFIDTDEVAEYMIEMPISDYFAQGKEAEFRNLETQILSEMSQYIRVVISTGGGVVMKSENWGRLHHGIVVFLDVQVETIMARFQKPEEIAKRPLLNGDADPLAKLKSMRAERLEYYQQADVTVTVPADSTDEAYTTPEGVANVVIDSILQHIKDNPPKWKQWKEAKDSKAYGMASMANAGAANRLSANPVSEAQKGSVSYVSLSDIQSGKVDLSQIQGLPKESP